MADTSLRLLTMLQLIPGRAPGKTCSEIRLGLVGKGFEISQRSVERDLDRVSGVLPITNDEQRPARWIWASDAASVSLPSHDAHSALTWQLIEAHIKPLLPRSLQREAEPRFREAREYIEAIDAKRFRRWQQRVRVRPRSLALQPPEVRPEVLDTVYDGLFEMRQIEISYRRRDDRKLQNSRIHPLGMVLREGAIYLVVSFYDYDEPLQIVAHRIESARLTDRRARDPAGFDLDEYIRDGAFDYSDGGKMRLVLRMGDYFAQHLLETRLSKDQQSRLLGDGRFEIEATVLDSMQLRWWLMGFGSNLEVIAPDSLREELRQEYEKLAAHYRRPPA